MTMSTNETNYTPRYARAVEASKRVRWELESDVIRGRSFDLAHKFMPDGLSLVGTLPFLSERERIFFSQVQGRTYANLFALVERWVNASVLGLSKRHLFGDQVALEALVRFSDEELKHQALFRRIEELAGQVMPDGYQFALDANQVAPVVLGKPSWSVLALTFLIELYTQAHYKQSIAPDEQLSPLFRDVYRFHWLEESQHALVDELEWLAEDGRSDESTRIEGVTGLIDLVGALDGLLKLQADADTGYFVAASGGTWDGEQTAALRAAFLAAYRYQHIFSGVQETRFVAVLRGLIAPAQLDRIVTALAALG
jgi:hypothetical protein